MMDSLEAQRNLSDKDLAIFNAEVQRQSKSAGLAYVLWFFVGWLGVHNFYMGKVLWGLAYLLFLGFGYLFLFSGFLIETSNAEDTGAAAGVAMFGLLLLLLLGLLLVWDLFTIPRQLRLRERKIKNKILKQLNSTA